jgi:hypothetical protein
MRSLIKCAVLAGAASLASCATTTFVSTWKAPDAQSLKGEGNRVVTVVMTKNDSMRLAGEESAAREVTRLGGSGIPASTLLQNESNLDEARAKEILETQQIAAILTLRPTNVQQETYATPAAYPSYWGGYYGYGWGAPYGAGVDVRTDTNVFVEAKVFSVKQNKLIWSGQSKTTNPGDLDALMKDVIAAVASELKKNGLI